MSCVPVLGPHPCEGVDLTLALDLPGLTMHQEVAMMVSGTHIMYILHCTKAVLALSWCLPVYFNYL